MLRTQQKGECWVRTRILFGLSVIGLIWSVGTFANQSLNSPGAVLDALNQRTGNVIVAMVDDPRGRAQFTTQIANRLRGLDVSLNAQALGTMRTNTLRYVRPRLGVNRLAVETSDGAMRFQFPAFRSAGVATGIVVLTSGAADAMRLTPLASDDVARIRDALSRSLAGGMPRVIALIQNRGVEQTAPPRPQSGQWMTRSDGASTERDSGNDSNGSDASVSTSASAEPASDDSTADATASESSESSDPESASNSEGSEEPADSAQDFDVSADRRSFY